MFKYWDFLSDSLWNLRKCLQLFTILLVRDINLEENMIRSHKLEFLWTLYCSDYRESPNQVSKLLVGSIDGT